MATGYPTYEIDRFRSDVKNHELEILHDDGLYRHLRCAQTEHSWRYRFDIVTWPGHLSITGDFGDGHTFARITDMFEFFRAKAGWNAGRINPQYWAEKLITGRDSTRRHSAERFRQHVDEHVKDAIEYQPELAKVDDDHVGLAQAVAAALTDEYDPDYAETAREFLRDFEYRYELPALSDDIQVGDALAEALGSTPVAVRARRADATWRFGETWEWDFNDWDWSYLWACHAIQWAIEHYDAAKGTGAPAIVDIELPAGAVAV